MQRIDARTVSLTVEELATADDFDRMLNKGHGIPFAAKVALNGHCGRNRIPASSVDDAFVAWLSERTVEVDPRVPGKFRVRPDWQQGPGGVDRPFHEGLDRDGILTPSEQHGIMQVTLHSYVCPGCDWQDRSPASHPGVCPECGGYGMVGSELGAGTCPTCAGNGVVESRA